MWNNSLMKSVKSVLSTFTQNNNESTTTISSTGNTMQIRPSSTTASNITFTMPPTTGTSNQVLKTDGSGNLDWTSITTNKNITVTANSLAYRFAGTGLAGNIDNPTLTVKRGETYVFDNTAVNAPHPFLIMTTDSISGSPPNGVTGNASSTLTWTVRMDETTPTTVYYMCQYHQGSGMKGTINIV